MKTITLAVIALLAQQQSSTLYELHPGRCYIQKLGEGRLGQRYVCESASGLSVPVARDWFKHHCRTYDGSRTTAHDVAQCDEAAPNHLVLPEPLARPSKWHGLGDKVLYISVAVLIIGGCAIGGGCGFMGGR